MVENDLINEYSEVHECEYKGELYSVRDNGAILRHPKGTRLRKLDNVWTFGIKNNHNGYKYFGGNVRVHIVVATAFYGVHDSKKMVVDHIDTNRCNNRVENLRWVTRLENALNNPATLKRITWLCGGDIQKFIENPSCLRVTANDAQDLSWMRTVSAEEAKNAYANVMRWATRPIASEGYESGASNLPDKEWMFKPPKEMSKDPTKDIDIVVYSDIIPAASPSVACQRNWKTPTSFVKCPHVISDSTLDMYERSLLPDVEFSENQYGKTFVKECGLTIEGDALIVRTSSNNNIKPGGAVTKITVENGKIVHENMGTYFTEAGACKQFVLAQGLEWDGPDSFDDYC